uniref:Steroid 5-alpha reductase C-terminal domain-containing protein n=1 Tax=Amphora coffeiformis TaxID=265554 RepID=A0A7S3PCE5_9STRA|mmetsp:Transcript_15043/g.28511  ORF Transcript_15043/g.28511 Transcript_15043/m.28511 type:complete len:339 (-) Transcript_15043:190-1206(-)
MSLQASGINSNGSLLYGVLGLTTTSAAVLIPATQIQPLYGVTIGYGAAMAAMGVALQCSGLPPSSHYRSPTLANSLTAALICYGTRLSLFLWLRQALQWRPTSTTTKNEKGDTAAAHSKMNDMSRWKRIPFALSLSLFYACLATPVLFVVAANGGGDDKRTAKGSTAAVTTATNTITTRLVLQTVGVLLAWGGLLIESIADGHKSWVKSSARSSSTKDNDPKNNNDTDSKFVGPTGGLYGIVRHPNYLGEVLFYTGLCVTAVPSLGTSLTGWICSTMGWTGITSLMRGSTRKLVDKQNQRYGGQEAFETWKRRVPYPWIPFVKEASPTTTATKNQKTD